MRMGRKTESEREIGLHVTEAADDEMLDDIDERLDVTEAMLDEIDASDELAEDAEERTEDNEDADAESVADASALVTEDTTESTELKTDVALARTLVAEDKSEDTDETTDETLEATAETTELTTWAEAWVASIEIRRCRYMAAMVSMKIQRLQVSVGQSYDDERCRDDQYGKTNIKEKDMDFVPFLSALLEHEKRQRGRVQRDGVSLLRCQQASGEQLTATTLDTKSS